MQQDGQEIIHVNDYTTEDGTPVNNGIYYTDGTETYEFEAGKTFLTLDSQSMKINNYFF